MLVEHQPCRCQRPLLNLPRPLLNLPRPLLNLPRPLLNLPRPLLLQLDHKICFRYRSSFSSSRILADALPLARSATATATAGNWRCGRPRSRPYYAAERNRSCRPSRQPTVPTRQRTDRSEPESYSTPAPAACTNEPRTHAAARPES
jgi:hypothetical protein